MSKHTKGEWTIELAGIDAGDDKLIIGHPNPNDFNVIRTIGRLFQNRPYDEMEANARLIAAAPETKQQRDDLLTACEELMKAWIQPTVRSMYQLKTDMDNAYKLAKAATAFRRKHIAKAKP